MDDFQKKSKEFEDAYKQNPKSEETIRLRKEFISMVRDTHKSGKGYSFNIDWLIDHGIYPQELFQGLPHVTAHKKNK